MLYVLPWGQMSFWGEFSCPICLSNSSDIRLYSLFAFIGPHNYFILSILTGSLLGNGSAEFFNNSTRICFNLEAPHTPYLFWFHSLIYLQGYTPYPTPTLNPRLGKYGKIRHIMRFHTYSYSSFNWIHDSWYNGKIKRIPDTPIIEKYLSPLTLTIWLMHDGAKVSTGLKFYTNGFRLSDVERLSLLLHLKFNLFTNIQSAGRPDQYIIFLPNKEIEKLKQIVGPYLHPTMKYKLY